jgi:hypothetical protein
MARQRRSATQWKRSDRSAELRYAVTDQRSSDTRRQEGGGRGAPTVQRQLFWPVPRQLFWPVGA